MHPDAWKIFYLRCGQVLWLVSAVQYSTGSVCLFWMNHKGEFTQLGEYEQLPKIATMCAVPHKSISPVYRARLRELLDLHSDGILKC